MKHTDLTRFMQLCDLYRDAAKRLDTDEGRREFIRLSVQIHIAKGRVPKRYWKLANIHRKVV